MIPGEYFLNETKGPVPANQGRRTAVVLVKHTGDRPIQVGSHYHFFEVNRALAFDRNAAFGMRLNIAAGTAVRFEPGEAKQVQLTEFGGGKFIQGFHGLVSGAATDRALEQRAAANAKARGFLFSQDERL